MYLLVAVLPLIIKPVLSLTQLTQEHISLITYEGSVKHTHMENKTTPDILAG